VDARARRSFDRLSAAVLDLAAAKPPEAMSVAEIARAAGVHRSTFYEHSDSPSTLLRAVLRGELDEARERHLGGEHPRDWAVAVGATTRDVLRHLEAHRAVYLRSFDSPADASLRSLLGEHFRASIVLLAEHGAFRSPVADVELVARYVADGTVGAVSVWLSGAGPRDPEAFLRDFARLVPPWWPLSPGAVPERA
jgi:AcrR family transcriptional regulator